MNDFAKQNFASYLEETADEIRLFPLTKAYLDDMCSSLIRHTNEFWEEAKEDSKPKVIE